MKPMGKGDDVDDGINIDTNKLGRSDREFKATFKAS